MTSLRVEILTQNDLGQLEAPKSSKSSKKAWSEEEDLILQNGVATEGGPRNWKRIAKKYFNNFRMLKIYNFFWSFTFSFIYKVLIISILNKY